MRDLLDEKVDYCLYYFFDNQMNCAKVGEDDKFTALHQKFEAQGRLTKKLDKQYYEDLRKDVLYWDGERFVNYLMMNRNYKHISASNNNSLLYQF